MFSHKTFETTPKTYVALTELIDDFSSKKDVSSQQVLALLEQTKKFIINTARDNRDDRASWSSESKLNLLNTAGMGLARFLESKSVNDPAYQYCARFLNERLMVLHDDKDELFTCYLSTDNKLKEMLSQPEKVAKPY